VAWGTDAVISLAVEIHCKAVELETVGITEKVEMYYAGSNTPYY